MGGHRRRFRGYCPPTSRRSSNIVATSIRDDFTTTLNSLQISVVAPNQIHIAVKKDLTGNKKTSDQELDELESILSQGNGQGPPSLAGIHRRSHQTVEYHQRGFVTSLSFDVPDENLSKAPEARQGLSLASREESGPPKEIRLPQEILSVPFKDATILETVQDEAFAPSDISSSDELSVKSELEVVLEEKAPSSSFLAFRVNYLIVTVAIMLADGLQGTHLYVLYEGYGFSVASLYCLGFVTGAVTSPITGPLVDRLGRKKAALIYCALEIFINMLEQYPILAGLIASRMIGGVTTNLLSSVFETWLDTEYRRQGFDQEKYEIVMRDSVVVSNLAAIASGYIAHELAERLGPVGPFEGAVTCTVIALAVVMVMWTENYGSTEPGVKSVKSYMTDAVESFKSDSKLLRVGLIQGCTAGSIQIFIFLWSPALRQLAQHAPKTAIGLDSQGEPAYGLIFGAFMLAGVLGGCISPFVRQGVTFLLSPLGTPKEDTVEVEGEGKVRPMAVEFLASFCYFICALLLLTPCLVSSDGTLSFALALGAFVIYELIIGIYMPCEGVIRSLYIPSDSRCSLLTLPRIIVNLSVALGVISTNIISLTTAFYAVSFLMMTSAVLQLSLVSPREWASLFGRVDRWKKKAVRSLSFSATDTFPIDFADSCRRMAMRSKSMPPTVLEENISCGRGDFDGDDSSFDKKNR